MSTNDELKEPVNELTAPVTDNEMPKEYPQAEDNKTDHVNYEQQINKMSAQIDYLNSKIAQLEVQIENTKNQPTKPKNIIF